MKCGLSLIIALCFLLFGCDTTERMDQASDTIPNQMPSAVEGKEEVQEERSEAADVSSTQNILHDALASMNASAW